MRSVIFMLLFTLVFPVAIAISLENEEKDTMATPPHFFNIGSSTETSALSMECEGDKPYKVINCYFSEIIIRKNRDNGSCGIKLYTYQETMHRITDDRWSSQLYGGGVRTIEKDPLNHVLWKYTEITNDTPSKIVTFSWDSPTKHFLKCEDIVFIGGK